MKLVRRPAKEAPRDRALKDEKELRGFLDTIDEMRCDQRVKLALLITATAARPQEITSMRWRDVDLETNLWTLPGELTKTGDSRTIPIHQLALTHPDPNFRPLFLASDLD